MLCLDDRDSTLASFDLSKKFDSDHPGCWLWAGNHYENGYAQVYISGKPMRVSRIIAYYFHGLVLSSDLKALHKCDVRGCWNPDHIFVGTQSDNIKDCVNKGRHHEIIKTHCKRGHPLNGTNLYIYNNKRSCKICRKAHTYKSLGLV